MANTTETKTFYPNACEDYKVSNSNIETPENPVGKGSDNTTYASIYAYWDTSYAYWPFDASVIPEEAVIDSVECKAKVRLNSTSEANARLQLFSGDTAKGSPIKSVSRIETVYSLTTGTWTRSELNLIRLKTEVESTKANNRTLYFYGADLTVTYTYNSEKFMLKLGGAWADAARVFKKVSGIWVEQTELSSVVEDGVRYQNGGEYVAPVQKISFTIAGTSYQAEQGMTWGEWVASSYNTAGYQIVYNESQSGIMNASGTKVVYDPENRIFPPSTYAIANGREYTLQLA